MALYLSLFFLSAAALAFEILLLRVFAIQEFVHFAYMAITIALLGFGAAGTALALARSPLRGREPAVYRGLALAGAVALVLTPWLAASVPFEPTRLVWEPRQWAYLAALYVVLALPFLLLAGAVALSFMWRPERTPALYAANLLGSGAGAAAALLGMAALPPERLPFAAAALAGVGAAIAWAGPRRAWIRNAVAAVVLAAVIPVGVGVSWELRVTQYKGLPQATAYPQAEIVGERWGPLGWVVALEAPALRHAPGLSLAFTGQVPPQVALFVDGVQAGAATRWGGEPGSLEFLKWTTAALPYRMSEPGRVAVLGSGGGQDVLAALAHGVGRIDAIELNPDIVELAEAQVDPLSAPYHRPGVRLVIGDARSFMRTRDGDYDLIQLAALQPFGAAAGGVYALSEDYLHTVEAFETYLARLGPEGVLAITHWLRFPARDGLKLLATADASLRALGYEERGGRVAYYRSWATGTLMVKPSGFTRAELTRLRSAADHRLFDAAWFEGIDSAAVNRFNRLEDPIYYRAARSLFEGEPSWEEFRADYPFVVEPATDDRPYFGHFLKASTVPRLMNMTGAQWLPFAEWGYLVLLATLAQAVAVSLVLIVAPAAIAGSRHGLAERRWRWLIPYFGAIGLGYLFIEIAIIQKMQLLLGHPVYAVLATLTSFLIFSGVGSALLAPRVRARPWLPALAVGLLAPFYIALMPVLFDAIAGSSLLVRGVISGLALLPLAGVMGAPFPVALSAAAEDDRDSIPWAWAVNGYASVVAVTLATVLAVHFGFGNVMGLAAVLYLAAALAAFLGPARRREPRAVSSGAPVSSTSSLD